MTDLEGTHHKSLNAQKSKTEAISSSHHSINPTKPPPNTPLITSIPKPQRQRGREDGDGQVRDPGPFVGEPDFLFDFDGGGEFFCWWKAQVW